MTCFAAHGAKPGLACLPPCPAAPMSAGLSIRTTGGSRPVRLPGGIPVPARAQRRHQKQPASSLLLRVGCSAFAEVSRCWRPRVGIPDFDKDSCAVARQPQADSRFVASCRSLHGVGHQLADEQFAVWGQPVQSPLPTARAWHAAGRRAPRSAERRVRGNCGEEVPVRRDGKQGRRRS
jgi:hypothetical protein